MAKKRIEDMKPVDFIRKESRKLKTMDEMKMKLVIDAYIRAEGNQSLAARLIDVNIETINLWLKKAGIDLRKNRKKELE